MVKKKPEAHLNVYLNNLHLGALRYKSRKFLTFQYASEWLERKNNFPISRSLPLQEDEFSGEEVFAYFDNLLPDGTPIRQRIAARMHAASDQVFDLLVVVGRDCVGALQFMREGEAPSSSLEPVGTPITNKNIAEKLRSLKAAPLAASEEEDFRLSIAGAQEKTALLKLNGKWYVPHDGAPTTHIFKPQTGGIRPGVSFHDSVENEWLCAQIVKAFGLPVANCEISEFEDIKVLVVERFDRQWSKSRLIRIPQEDMCQALGVPNFEKYQSDGGPGMIQIMSLLNESIRREEDRNMFIKSQLVFLLLAAIDGHAKNFSMRWGPRGFWMTPLYDMLSAQPLVDKGTFQYQKIKMALAVGKKPHWKVTEIYRRHFLQSASLSRYDKRSMEERIDETMSQVDSVIDKVSSALPRTFPDDIAHSIFAGMKKRVAHLTAIAE